MEPTTTTTTTTTTKKKKPSKITKKQQVLFDARKAYQEELQQGRRGPKLINLQEIYLDDLSKWYVMVSHYNMQTQQTTISPRVPLQDSQLTEHKLMVWWLVPIQQPPVVLSCISVYWNDRPLASIRLSREQRLVVDRQQPLVIPCQTSEDGPVTTYFERQQTYEPTHNDVWFLSFDTEEFALGHTERV